MGSMVVSERTLAMECKAWRYGIQTRHVVTYEAEEALAWLERNAASQQASGEELQRRASALRGLLDDTPTGRFQCEWSGDVEVRLLANGEGEWTCPVCGTEQTDQVGEPT